MPNVRFEINGVLGNITPHFGRRATDPVAAEAPARFKFDGSMTAARSGVELLAGKVGAGKAAPEAPKRVVYYRIKISRTGENAFRVNVQER